MDVIAKRINKEEKDNGKTSAIKKLNKLNLIYNSKQYATI